MIDRPNPAKDDPSFCQILSSIPDSQLNNKIHILNKSRLPLLFWCIRLKLNNSLQLLLSRKASCQEPLEGCIAGFCEGFYPLHFAIAEDNSEAALMLIQHDANSISKRIEKMLWTPLHLV